MDILCSRILEIDGRLYVSYQNDEVPEPYTGKPTVREDPTESWVNDNTEEEFLTSDGSSEKFEKTEHGYLGRVQAPAALFKYVIGKGGETKRRLEYETGTKIIIPPRRQEGDIKITSNSSNGIEAAISRIELMLSERKWKEPFNYFVSIPLVADNLKDGFRKFRTEVLSKHPGDRGIEEKIFQNENKLHLTIATLVLLDENERKRAVEVLECLKASFQIPSCLEINVNGVEYMNDDPEMVDVLYAKAVCKGAPDALQKLADDIASGFQSAGLSKKEHDHVKLHATVMNSLLAIDKQPRFQKNQKPSKRETFDAKNILQEYSNFAFGEFQLKEIHLSKRFTTSEDGYYDSLHVLTV